MSTVRVTQLWSYPVKSVQGEPIDTTRVEMGGLTGDRRWGLIDSDTGTLMSAKRWSKLLMAHAVAENGSLALTLPDGAVVRPGDVGASDALSAWLGRDVELREVSPNDEVAYEMTLDPPNDEAELFAIPAPKGSFLDLAAVHLLSAPTLAEAARRYPELQWDVRRFRPNIVVDGDLEPFDEDTWTNQELRVGSAVLRVRQPTVRCALPLRGQPGLERQPGLFNAMNELHNNHLGLYIDVVEPGEISVGDELSVLA